MDPINTHKISIRKELTDRIVQLEMEAERSREEIRRLCNELDSALREKLVISHRADRLEEALNAFTAWDESPERQPSAPPTG